jgi:hypothetical protein
MLIKSVFYISCKTTPWPDDGPDIAAITEVARARNSILEVTGALISTAPYFAQILEGPGAAVDAVMASILRDPRHNDLKVLQEGPRRARWFGRWSLAFAGRSSYIGARMEPLLAEGPLDGPQVDWLLKLIQAFDRSL